MRSIDEPNSVEKYVFVMFDSMNWLIVSLGFEVRCIDGLNSYEKYLFVMFYKIN